MMGMTTEELAENVKQSIIENLKDKKMVTKADIFIKIRPDEIITIKYGLSAVLYNFLAEKRNNGKQ